MFEHLVGRALAQVRARFRASLRAPGRIIAGRQALATPIALSVLAASVLIVLSFQALGVGPGWGWQVGMLLVPWSLLGRGRWFGGWVLVAQVVLLTTYVRPLMPGGAEIVYAGAYLLAPLIASQLYSVAGVALASALQLASVLYFTQITAPLEITAAALLPMLLILVGAALLIGFSEYVRDFLSDELRAKDATLADAYDATLVGLAEALALRDNETAAHSARVTDLTMVLAAAYPFTVEERTHMRRGAVLHDIGKIGVPDAILQKPGTLTDDEWLVMRQHPLLAVQVLANIGFLQPALTIPRWHHERWDGSGYPDGLVATAIPLEARIFAVVDVWDALTNERPYHAAKTPEVALRYLREQAGRLFDPAVVAQFSLLAATRAGVAGGRDRAAA